MLEEVGVHAVAARRRRPHVRSGELDEVEPEPRVPILPVCPCLWVREGAVDAGDSSRLALEVARRPVVPARGAVGDADLSPDANVTPSTLASISPGARTPFSSRIVSTVKSQRS